MTMQPRQYIEHEHQTDKPSSAWESFNIRQKLGQFDLGSLIYQTSPQLRQIEANGWVGLTLTLRFDTWKYQFLLKYITSL